MIIVLFFLSVQHGDRGYGYTVFRGDSIEKFNVEVMAVVSSGREKLILARLYNGFIDTVGVVAGMSGSPVYIDDRLVGGIMATEVFLKTPMAWIRPIENIKEKKGGGGNLSSNIHLFIDRDIAKPYVERWLKDVEVGLFDGMGEYKFVKQNIKPGEAMGVGLLLGDLDIAALGTVTEVEDGLVYGFAHSMFNLGDVNYPFGKARIYGVIPSEYLSHKVGNLVSINGTVEWDGSSGIVGRIGKKPDLMKIKISVNGESYRFFAVKNKKLTGSLIDIALSYAIEDSQLPMEEASGIRIRAFRNGKKIVNMAMDTPSSDVDRFTGYLDEYLYLLWNNDIKEMFPDSLEISLEKKEIYEIKYVIPERCKVKSGENLKIKVILENSAGKKKEEILKLRIPPFLGDKYFFLGVETPAFSNFYDLSAEKNDNLDDTLDILRYINRMSFVRDSLVLRIYTKFLKYANRKGDYIIPPPSFRSRAKLNFNLIDVDDTPIPVFRKSKKVNYIVKGLKEVKIQVD